MVRKHFYLIVSGLQCTVCLFEPLKDAYLIHYYGRPAYGMRTLYFCPVVSIFLFFPRLISAVADWMSTILLHMVCLSANLECRSEMCCMWLAGNTGRKKSPSAHHGTTLPGYIVATKAGIAIYIRQGGQHAGHRPTF